MYALLIYSLKVGVCLAVFYLFFRLCLARETLHRLNRVLILAAVALSFVLPVAVVTVYREVPRVALPAVMAEMPVVGEMSESAAEWNWQPWLGVVFLLGAAVMLVRTGWALVQVSAVIRRGRRRVLDDGAVLVLIPHAVTPFSWGRYIVISEEDYARCGEVIVTHEEAHRRLRHTVDLLFMDLAGVLQWFNPAMWLLKRDLRDLHEYEADAAVLRSGVDAREYQLLLIKKAVGGRWYSVANCFNHSKLKNRITMMLQKKSSKLAGVKALLLLPLVGCAVGAFAETVDVPVGDKDTQKIDSVFVVRDGNTSSVSASEKPRLVVVDGKVMDKDFDLSKMDAKNIASITVLKGKSATEKYGKKAEGGVIEVTTKEKNKSVTVSVGDREIEVYNAQGSSAGEAEPTIIINDGNTSSVPASAKQQLVVVDGKVMDKDFDLSKVDSKKIASITVLKGKSATEKYGDKAAGGVLEVTLKE